MSNVVRMDQTPKTDYVQVEPLVAAQKFITFQNGGSCSTSVPSLDVNEALAWWANMFSEVDDGCGDAPANNDDDNEGLYERGDESQDDDIMG